MLVTASRWAVHVILEAVATVEELADVTADVVLEHEAAAWVLVNELVNVEDEFVQNDKLAPVDKSLLELLRTHGRTRQHERNFLSQLDLEHDLSHDQQDKENGCAAAPNAIPNTRLTVVVVKVVGACPNHELTHNDDKPSVPLMHLANKEGLLGLPWHLHFQPNYVPNDAAKHQ